MPGPTEIDPNAPSPWAWVPDSWRDTMGNPSDEQLSAMAPPPDGLMQPGLGIPAATLDAAAAAPGHPNLALQPGLGIPEATLDAAAIAPPYHPPVAELVGPTTEMVQPYGAPPVPYGVPVPPEEAARSLPSEATAVRPPAEDPNQPESTLASLSPEQARDLAIKDPVKFAMLVAGQQQEWQQHLARNQQLIDDQQNYQAEMALKTKAEADARTQAKMDVLYKRVDELAHKSVDPNRYLNSRTTTRRIADFIGAIAGGAAAGQVPGGNGVNHYVEWMQKEIDRDIDAQKSDLENQRQGLSAQRGMVAEEFARTGNMYQATQAVRLASYTAARNDLLTQQQLYDPRGRRAAAIGQAAGEMNGRIVAAQQQIHQQQNELELKQAKTQLEYMTQQANERHAREDEKTARANTAMVGWGHAITKQNNLAAQTAKQRELDIAEQKEKDSLEKSGGGPIGGVATGIDADGNVKYTNPDGSPAVLTQADGKPFVIKEKETKQHLTKMIAASDRVNDLANKLSREIDNWGGQSDIRKSPRWQIIKGDYEAMLLALHGAKEIDGFRGNVLDAMKELTGDVDPTSFFRDARAGIINARDNINQDIDTALRRRANYTGAEYKPLDTSQNVKLPPTPSDKRLELALENPMRTEGVSMIREFGVDPKLPEAHPIAMEKFRDLGMLPSQAKVIDEIAADLKSTDKAVRERAAADLENIRASSGATGARAYAAEALQRSVADVATPPDRGSDPSTSTVKDESYGAKKK